MIEKALPIPAETLLAVSAFRTFQRFKIYAFRSNLPEGNKEAFEIKLQFLIDCVEQFLEPDIKIPSINEKIIYSAKWIMH